MGKTREYKAKDCLSIQDNRNNEISDIKHGFLSKIQSLENIDLIKLSTNNNEANIEPIVSYKDGKWCAGRYIGFIHSKEKNTDYKLTISPRFGEASLMNMLYEINNFKLFNNGTGVNETNDSFDIKAIVALLWIKKFENANHYGLPRRSDKHVDYGTNIKGKILVSKSIIKYKTEQKLCFQHYEFDYDEKILNIVNAAYNILREKYGLDLSRVSSNTRKKLLELESACNHNKKAVLTKADYYSIAYNPIYLSYKDIVDFSWQIITSSTGVKNKNEHSNTYGLLIDMAEVWECYIRSLVSKWMSRKGWVAIIPERKVYNETFYKRKIIPDMAFEKNNSYCVFDAKYKKMQYRKEDVDREDFFQIHSYVSYFQQIGSVCCAGLLYPIENIEENKRNTVSSLFGEKTKCKFIVDGPYVAENIDDPNKRFFNLLDSTIYGQ